MSILQSPLDFRQSVGRDSCIDMKKPKDVAARHRGAGIHLHSAIRASLDDPIAKIRGKFRRSIGALPIGNDDLRFRCAFAQMREKISNERGFVKCRNND